MKKFTPFYRFTLAVCFTTYQYQPTQRKAADTYIEPALVCNGEKDVKSNYSKCCRRGNNHPPVPNDIIEVEGGPTKQDPETL